MPSLGDMYVQVQGDWTRFHTEVAAEVAALAKVDFKVRPHLDNGPIRTEMRLFRLQFLRDQTFRVRPELAPGFTAGTFDDKTFKVEPFLDTTIFRRQMQVFRLQWLRDQRFTVHADADTFAASARLAALAAQATALGGMRPTIRVNPSGLDLLSGAMGRLSTRMQLLISAALILGPAIVPIGAAAAGGMFALAGAAAAAGAGIGVLALSLIGVVGALKAMSAARDAAAKANALAVRQDTQMASSAEGLRSALATLANTRASAATGAANAARSIADAERSLANAQRTALAAQQDITRARLEARQAMEDLASSVANNSLSLRQANLDLAEAKRELDRVLADPTATNAQREQAQLNYDRAVQQITDLTVRQGRLQAEQTASAQAGVEGSNQVVTAVNRLRDAQEAVTDAERNLVAARQAAADQQRQSAFAIEQALHAVTSAQRTMATAAVSTSSTAGAAMDELARKMAGLSNEGRQFVLFVFGLRQEALQLRRVAEAGFLPGFQSAIQRLLPFMPQLIDFVDRVARGLGDIADRSAAALASSAWRPFFSYLDGTAVPTLREMGETFDDIILGLANMIIAFAPVQRQIGGGLRDMAADFAAWSSTLRTNRDFQEFLDYVVTRGPMVMATLGDIVSALMRLAIATAPVGDVVLSTLRALSEVIAFIPTPLLTGLVMALGALRIAGLVAPMVMALVLALRAFNLSVIGVVSTTAATTAFAAALRGPVLLGITAVIVAIGFLMARSSQAKANVDALKSAMMSFADTMAAGITPETIRSSQAMLAQDKNMRDLMKTMEEVGVSQETLVSGLRGDKEARDLIVASINAEIASLRAYLSETNLQRRANKEERDAALARIGLLERQRGAITETSTAQAESNELTRRATEAALELARASGMLTPVQRAVADAHRILGDAMSTTEEKTEALRIATRALHEAAMTQIDTQERYARALLNAKEALETNEGALDMNSIAALGNRDAVEEVIRASGEMYDQDIAAGIGMDIATQKHKDRIAELIREAIASGANEKEIRDLISAYDAVPGDVNTDVQTRGLEQVFKDLVNLAIAQRALQEGITPQAALAKYGWMYATPVYQGHAEGGLVTGPGGPTEDKVPATLMSGGRVVAPIRLSDGEYVQKAAAVDFYGVGAMAAINEMKVPRERLTGTGMAQGGLVENWPFFIDVTKTLLPDIMGLFGATGPIGPGVGFPPWGQTPKNGGFAGDSGVWRSILNLVRASGIPYSFGNAFRRGDPLWHGAGRAIDFMGYNQDRLATFFNNMRPRVLELIHRTNTRDYGITRGRFSPFHTQWPKHVNHIHIAMAEGGPLGRIMDSGGILNPREVGANTSGRRELMLPEGMKISLSDETIGRLVRGYVMGMNSAGAALVQMGRTR